MREMKSGSIATMFLLLCRWLGEMGVKVSWEKAFEVPTSAASHSVTPRHSPAPLIEVALSGIVFLAHLFASVARVFSWVCDGVVSLSGVTLCLSSWSRRFLFCGCIVMFFCGVDVGCGRHFWLRRCRSQRFNFLVSIRTLDDIFDFLSTFPVDNCTSPKFC